MSTTNFNIRMDEQLKEEAFPIIESYGLTPAQAIKLFLKQIADTKAIPLNFEYKTNHIPNDLTKLAMLELLSNRSENTLTKYSSLDELMDDIKG
ncbi:MULTISPECIES: type II toxin-antitoxin system RelB/DinJ family antitoxin [Oligella]|uniref:Uncharacterized protein n=1 Tax=Oligella urethralis DNF00040 TaxID=1401065 RepID=A0A096A2Q5_9BURK|nr:MULTISPECIES: type II toxin-antitoxin system RelB/DinJ family antitoxin [Oligella]KGF25037.1 hypothetical protein HMPREF2130_11620 [Oligella urethralis DNF00040]OFS86886.1 toxin-antitoxin system antitoxin subunit [Oligella sp. HMSC05A10]PMC14471.1 type II toxin-antitoxin system antitoxin, RelB/DinJ family [Oligella urethralis]WOS37780.1 Antitoxin RelB [Oligella urethralis]SUA60406.1 Antitoxin RelB [Oligella urethralis]